ncbi:Activating signal cointegrator 1 [Schistosoma japonicum]|nr:Activating signal cointegrator 1 [Schistosoma japonicum]KAH8851396.1 Activating signal cointegrator 1 [Schistosoma japonicum]
MEKVRSTLTEVLGEKAAEDFIKTCIEVEDTKVIKRRVSTLLDTRKLENRQVYEILIREKIRRNGFTGEGYRKSSCNSSDPSTSLKKVCCILQSTTFVFVAVTKNGAEGQVHKLVIGCQIMLLKVTFSDSAEPGSLFAFKHLI